MAVPTIRARSSTLNMANVAIAEVIPNRFRAWRRDGHEGSRGTATKGQNIERTTITPY